MITYVLSQFHRLLREAPVDAPRVSLDRTHFVVHVDATLHRVRRDLVCDCGGTQPSPCPALPLVRDYLANGGSRPPGPPGILLARGVGRRSGHLPHLRLLYSRRSLP